MTNALTPTPGIWESTKDYAVRSGSYVYESGKSGISKAWDALSSLFTLVKEFTFKHGESLITVIKENPEKFGIALALTLAIGGGIYYYRSNPKSSEENTTSNVSSSVEDTSASSSATATL